MDPSAIVMHPNLSTTRIVCVSDNHSNFPKLPWGDVLIHAGDLTGSGSLEQVGRGLDWLAHQGHTHKILVPGNHDWLFQREPEKAAEMCAERGIVLLIDESYRACGLWFYGSPWQPAFCDWAFNLPRGPQLKAKWDQIPTDTDVLITHGPPMGVLDENPNGYSVGCEDLMRACMQIQPKLHVFGHIHGCQGVRGLHKTLFVNASLCMESYQCVNPPQVIHL